MNDREMNVAIDNAQAIVSRFAKPLEMLPQILLAVREGREELKTLEGQRTLLQKEIATHQGNLADALHDGAAQMADFKANAATLESELNTQLRRAQDDATSKMKALSDGVRAAQVEHDDALEALYETRAALENDVKTLTATKAELTSAVEALKKRFT